MSRNDDDSSRDEPSGEEPRSAERQPASPRDLERFPAQTELCLSVRGMLRDYADRDLSTYRRRRVDEHVHSCRDCGLALSRVELETMRLSRAFEAEAADVQKHVDRMTDLSDHVRARVIADGENVQPSADFTSSVMSRIQGDWRRPESAEEHHEAGTNSAASASGWRRDAEVGLLSRRRGWMISGGLAAALMVAAFVWVFGQDAVVRKVGPIARVVSVEGTVRGFDADGRVVSDSFKAGQVLRAGMAIETGADGALVLQVESDAAGSGSGDGSGGSLEAIRLARVEIDDLARIRFGAGSASTLFWAEGAGRVVVDRYDGLELDALRVDGLADGSAFLEPGGVYDLMVSGRRRFDGTPTASVRLEVLKGRAEVVRGGISRSIDSDRVAQFGHFQPLSVEAGMSSGLLEQARQTQIALSQESTSPVVNPVAAEALWVGRVVDDLTGLGVAGATVALDLQGRRVERTTDVRGEFELPTSAGDLCVVSVRAPSASDLHSVSPRPVSLPSLDGGRLETLRLVQDVAREGVVVDANGQPLASARVIPCIVDEVFGFCELRDDLAVASDSVGRFRVTGLPTGLAPSQSLMFLVQHESAPMTAYASRWSMDADAGAGASRNQLAAASAAEVLGQLDIRTDAPRDVQLTGLPRSQVVVVAQELPGLSLRSFMVRREVQVDERGDARLPLVGPGRLFLMTQDGETGMLLATELAAGDGSTGNDPAVLTVSDADPMSLGRRGRESTSSSWLARQGNRFAVLRDPSLTPTAQLLALDADSNEARGTRLYLMAADGSVEYLGEFDGRPIPFASPADGDFTVLAISPEGHLGWRTAADFLQGRSMETVKMRAPGAVAFEPGTFDGEATADGVVAGDSPVEQRAALLRFRLESGPLAGAEFWRVVRIEGQAQVEGHAHVDGLVPGDYVIEFANGGEIRASVLASGSVQVGRVVNTGR